MVQHFLGAGDGPEKRYKGLVEHLEEHPMEKVIDGGCIKGAHGWCKWPQLFLNTFAKGDLLGGVTGVHFRVRLCERAAGP